jgi:hypothetical protein
MYNCLCGKEFTNRQSFNGHKSHCRINLESKGKNVRPSNFGFRKKTTKGIPLTEEHKEKIANSLLGKSKGTALDPEKEKERRKKISETMKANPSAGGLREGSGRGVKTWYESPIAGRVYLRSTYELIYAKFLDSRQIKWKANKKSFEYLFEDKERRYYPDFYLIDEDCYVEIKGFKTKQDEAKWKVFPHKLKVLFGKDLEKLGG